eukprot:GHVS01096105.1.p3 GENE.GHVS01096105.1~~GHVS01096105.1.p3  ORF type:complete len:138 (+),score=48.47 GHVS01096105.1:831-1244(+)
MASPDDIKNSLPVRSSAAVENVELHCFCCESLGVIKPSTSCKHLSLNSNIISFEKKLRQTTKPSRDSKVFKSDGGKYITKFQRTAGNKMFDDDLSNQQQKQQQKQQEKQSNKNNNNNDNNKNNNKDNNNNKNNNNDK